MVSNLPICLQFTKIITLLKHLISFKTSHIPNTGQKYKINPYI